MPRIRLNEKNIATLKPGANGAGTWYQDTTRRGLMLFVRGDRRTWYFEFTTKAGRRRRMVLGEYPTMDIAGAADACAVQAREVAIGSDPLEQKAEERREATAACYRLNDAWADFLRRREGSWKVSGLTGRARTLDEYRRLWDTIVADTIGKKLVGDVTRDVLEQWHREQSAIRRVSANRCIVQIRQALDVALHKKLISYNPAARFRKNPEAPRQRYLSTDEIRSLLAVIDTEASLYGRKAVKRTGNATPGQRGGKGLKETESRGINPHAAALFQLLLFSGCRLNEILSCRWAWVDLSAGCLCLPDSKAGGAKTIWLNAEALAVIRHLATIRSAGHDYLIEGAIPGKPLNNPHGAWRRICQAAGLGDVKLHDLRHSYATLALAQGITLNSVGHLLGHKSTVSTKRYAHMAPEHIRGIAQSVTIGSLPAHAPKPAVPGPGNDSDTDAAVPV